MNLILIGFKSSGKSAIGKKISMMLNKNFIDMDDVIADIFFERNKKRSDVIEIYRFLKEEKFRLLEEEAFFSTKNVDNSIIATSGGCILNKNNLSVFTNKKTVIYLKNSKEILKKRISQEKRSVFNDDHFFEKEFINREKLYQQCADHIVLNDNKEILQICDEIMRILL
ncbi:MAG: shikimate kinase [Parachlamydiales bacterium]|jgi:shikimate kinase